MEASQRHSCHFPLVFVHLFICSLLLCVFPRHHYPPPSSNIAPSESRRHRPLRDACPFQLVKDSCKLGSAIRARARCNGPSFLYSTLHRIVLYLVYCTVLPHLASRSLRGSELSTALPHLRFRYFSPSSKTIVVRPRPSLTATARRYLYSFPRRLAIAPSESSLSTRLVLFDQAVFSRARALTSGLLELSCCKSLCPLLYTHSPRIRGVSGVARLPSASNAAVSRARLVHLDL
jgi:hypothetical protein